MSRILVDRFSEQHITDAMSLWQNTPGVGLSASDTVEQLRQFLKRNPTTNYVAMQNGVLIGALLCGHDGRRGYLHHLAVAKPFRNQGIASTLIDSALHALFLEGIHKCHAFVFKDNQQGVAFWKKSRWQHRNDLAVVSFQLR